MLSARATLSRRNPMCFVCGKPLDRTGLENVLADVACIDCKRRTRLLATDVELSTLEGEGYLETVAGR